MALLRQCLQELRLRRGEMDLYGEGLSAVAAKGRVAAPMDLCDDDDMSADRTAARSDVIAVRAFRALRRAPE